MASFFLGSEVEAGRPAAALTAANKLDLGGYLQESSVGGIMAAAAKTRPPLYPAEEEESHSELFRGMKISPRVIMHYKLPFT